MLGSLHIVIGQPDTCLIAVEIIFLLYFRLYRRAVNSIGNGEVHFTFGVEDMPPSRAGSLILG